MLIIPVLDLCGGIVVHAKQGERDNYQAISSVLTQQSQAEVVLAAYYNLFPFKIIYIADLDAIQGNGNNYSLIKALASEYPHCKFWLDAGIENIEGAFLDSSNIVPVLGSENRISKAKFRALIESNPDIILSLDFNTTGLLENSYLLTEADLWPRNVIVMMLHRVGSSEGPDLRCLNNVFDLDQNSDIYTAGGVRNINDLEQLNAKSIKGALLASALHNGAINKEELKQFFTE